MMKVEKILTLHPQDKKGVNISLSKYEQIKGFILNTLRVKKKITFEMLTKLANAKLSGKFEGKITWYIVTVKLDLEARGMIERIPGTSPHQLRFPAKSRRSNKSG